MFIYSIRASTLRVVGFAFLALVLVFGVVLSGQGGVVSAMSSATEIDYSGVKTKENRLEFISRFGIEVDPDSEEEEAFRMPKDFDRVILGYNQLQKKQGLDLSKYQNKKVTRYSYKVTNYKGEGEVYATLFIHRGKVVACDIASSDPEGFVVPLTRVNKSDLKQTKNITKQ